MEKEDSNDTEEKEDIEYYAIKCKLKSALRFQDMMPIINSRVDAVNKIWTEAYFLFNLYIIKTLNNNQNIYIDDNIINRCVLYVLNKQDKIRKNNITLNQINEIILNTVDKIKLNTNNQNIKELKKLLKDRDQINEIILNTVDKIKLNTNNQNIKELKKLLKERDQIISLNILDNVYKNIYLKLGNNELDNFNTIKSIGRPIEYLVRQVVVNIKNHISMNFWTFQKKYIQGKLYQKLIELKLKKNVIYSIINCIQYHINNKHDNIIIKAKNIKKLSKDDPKTYEYVRNIIINTIKTEKELIPFSLKDNITKNNLIKNYKDSLKYYFLMIKYLETNNQERFSLLPQLALGTSYVKFDSRFISTIYDEWINTKLKEADEEGLKNIQKKNKIKFELKEVGIKEFEKNYCDFYNKCFKFNEINKKDQAISFLTNGYSICILYKREVQKKDINDGNIKKTKLNLDNYHKDKKIKKGIFDADDITVSDEYLNNHHKFGIDPNNDVLLYCYSETGNKIKITKGYYNEISHITLNNKKMKKYIKKSSITKLYKDLSDSCYKKTIDIEKYKKFISIYRQYKKEIWNFYNENKVKALELDTYINKKKALHKIVRRIVPKYGYSIKFNKSQNKHVNATLYNKVQNMPILIAFGKGNGNITISNLKHKGPKGPVKALAFELSKYCTVILTDEYNTSKICSGCETETLIHPTIKKTITKKVKNKKNNTIEIKKTEVNYENYDLCYCNNNIHQSDFDVHKMWNRDYNASKNILQVMVKKVKGENLNLYKRKRLTKKIAEDDIIISHSKEWLASNGRSPNKKVSLLKTTTTTASKTTNNTAEFIQPIKALKSKAIIKRKL